MARPVDVVEKDLAARKEAALQAYHEYAASKAGMELPEAQFSFEPEGDRIAVHGDIITLDGKTRLHFESMQRKDADDIFEHLNNSVVVRAQYADGKTVSRANSDARVETLSKRFEINKNGEPVDPKLHLYSAFVVTDAETQDFIGMVNLGGGSKPREAEMALLNREKTWSHRLEAVVAEYGAEVDKKQRAEEKQYRGVGTAEICALFDYARHLKKNECTVNGCPLEAVVATARVTNKGSWMSCGNAGMEAYDVDVNEAYGPDLRYQLRYKI